MILLSLPHHTALSTSLMQRIISPLAYEFPMNDLSDLSYFLGIEATRDDRGIFLSQCKYVLDLLERANMSSCNPCRTPADTQSKLGTYGSVALDPTMYRN